MGRGLCVHTEQGSYDRLKKRWDTIPDEVRSKCIETNNAYPAKKDSYYWLELCIGRAFGASAPKFRY